MPSRPVPKSFLGNGTPRCPGLVGWTDMWWLPLGPCSTQPSASNRLINARATRRRGHTHWSSVLDWSGVVVVARSRAPCITWKQTRPAPTPRERLRVQQPVPAGWRPRMASHYRSRRDYHPGPFPRQRLRRTVPGTPSVRVEPARDGSPTRFRRPLATVPDEPDRDDVHSTKDSALCSASRSEARPLQERWFPLTQHVRTRPPWDWPSLRLSNS